MLETGGRLRVARPKMVPTHHKIDEQHGVHLQTGFPIVEALR